MEETGLLLGQWAGAVVLTLALTRALKSAIPATINGTRTAALALVVSIVACVAFALWQWAETRVPVDWARLPAVSIACWLCSMGVWSGGRAIVDKTREPKP